MQTGLSSLFWFLELFLLFHGLSVVSGGTTCKDNDGKDVEWFIVYKLPKMRETNNTYKANSGKNGLMFYYMDANVPHWKLNPRNINETGQAVQSTLQQVYDHKHSKNAMYIMYNDHIPHKKDPTDYRGHTKGVVAFDKTSGFWLVHSVPQFPPKPSEGGYRYMKNGVRYGQTMLCMSYSYKLLNTIGKQLKYNNPMVYECDVPESFSNANPNIRDVVNNKTVTEMPWSHIAKLPSLSGTFTFTSFAKYKNFNADLYAGLVSPYYKADLLVETYRNQHGAMPSNCTGSRLVQNIKKIKIGNQEFNSTKDHAKWAITRGQYITCIGDINRVMTQTARGGGTVCLENIKVWYSFHSLIAQVEPCP